ncbi:MAG TPA: ATP-binding protein [Burkholderiales bacterium]|nr:ATP-binding protein [Burkholderiales bacterium]
MTGLSWALLAVAALLVAGLFAWALRERRRSREHDERASALDAQVDARTRELEAAKQALESLSYAVSHDLRAPLRAIDGFSRILEERYARYVDDEGRRLLGLVRESARRLGTQMDSLLALSRLGRQALYPVDIDMRALAAEAWVEVAGDSGLDCTLEALPAARGDRQLLKQVWTNLFSNAAKFTARQPAPRIAVSGSQDGPELVYCVSDNGAGFDMRQQARLFKAFQRLHAESEFPGTGIGLATVERIVSRHGGRVWAEGVPQGGAKFYFTLPGGGKA